MSLKDQMLEARHLIKQKRYVEARRILRGVDHPTASKWLEKLDEIAPESEPQTKSNRYVWFVGGSVVTIVLVFVVAMILLQGDSGNEADSVAVVPTMIPTTAPTPTVFVQPGSTLDTAIPVGGLIEYEDGMLSVLDFHYPVGTALRSVDGSRSEAMVPLLNGNEYVGVHVSLDCENSCDGPRFARIDLVLSDGQIVQDSPVMSMVNRSFYTSETNSGWIYFHLVEEQSPIAIRVSSDDTELYGMLPRPRDGYSITPDWTNQAFSSQPIMYLPRIRRELDETIPTDDIYLSETDDGDSFIAVQVYLDRLYFETEEEILGEVYPILIRIAPIVEDYLSLADVFFIALIRRADSESIGFATIATQALYNYDQNDLTSEELLSVTSVSIEQQNPVVASQPTATNQEVVQATEPPVTLVQPTATQVNPALDVPDNLVDIEQYFLTNYSAIAGQSLSITRVNVASELIEGELFYRISIVLDYGDNGHALFREQTRAAATEYANRLVQDAEAFFGTSDGIFVSVSYSYYTDNLQDYHYDDDWWYIGNYDLERGWRVSQDFITAFFYYGTWDIEVWNYR